MRPDIACSSRRREQIRNPLMAKNRLTPFAPTLVKENKVE
jgi:hypothetical protein